MARAPTKKSAAAGQAADKAPAEVAAPNDDEQSQARFLQRYQRAKGKRDLQAAVIDECYEFYLPLRERIYCTGNLPATDRVFDSTGPDAVQNAASQMLDDVWPTDSKPFDLL